MHLSLYNLGVKEGCPLSPKTVRSTGTAYHDLIGLAEIYLSEHDPPNSQ